MHPLVFLLVVAGLAALGVVAFRAEEKRQRQLRHWARARGLARGTGLEHAWDERYPGQSVFRRGRSRKVALLLGGEVDGLPVTAMDYRFVTGSGKNRTTHHRAVVIVETGFPTIRLEIRREHVFDRVGEFLGHDDIDFESAEFSRTFHVSSPDRKWAYDVIHARTMEYLLTAPPFAVTFGFGEVAVIRNGRLNAQDAEAALLMARRLIELVPDYVIAQMRGGER
jgi:hypothetical protein